MPLTVSEGSQMELLDTKKVEDCFDGSVIFEYYWSEKIGEEFMKKLGTTGRLYYYPEFHRPFFKIITFDGLQIKGIIGDPSFQVIYPQTNKWEKKKAFEKQLLCHIE
jgi:hypothetical protein